MKVKLLKKLRKEFSSDFVIVEDPKREYGCTYVVKSTFALPYHVMSLESAKEYIREHVNKRISNYIEHERGRTNLFDANGKKIT